MKRLALLAAALLLAGCIPDIYGTKPEVKIDPDKAVTSSGNGVLLENPAQGSEIQLSVGDKLTIRLDANPTTGIWWSDPEFTDTVLSLESMDYTADPAPEGVVGSGGTTVLVFRAVGPGATVLSSNYSRGGGEVYERLYLGIEVSE